LLLPALPKDVTETFTERQNDASISVNATPKLSGAVLNKEQRNQHVIGLQ
jgi:hypothetical protein